MTHLINWKFPCIHVHKLSTLDLYLIDSPEDKILILENGTETYKYADSLDVKVSDCECFQYQKKYKAKSYTSTDVLIQKYLSDSLYMKKLNLHFNIKESFEIGDSETSREGEMKYNHLKVKKITKHSQVSVLIEILPLKSKYIT